MPGNRDLEELSGEFGIDLRWLDEMPMAPEPIPELGTLDEWLESQVAISWGSENGSGG